MNGIIVTLVFIFCYAGMVLGRFPKLGLDRTGIALLAALALLVSGVMTERKALLSLDIPTLALLFGLMVLSAQLRLGGFYTKVTLAISRVRTTPPLLLLIMMLSMGILSAVFSNDVICLAASPVIIGICRNKGLNPVPYLLGLACSANIGSALTIIGNPQNMLIGQALRIPFYFYMKQVALPVVVGLLLCWIVIANHNKGKWLVDDYERGGLKDDSFRRFNGWETFKGLLVALCLMILFIGEWWPRELCALGAAGFLLTSRKFKSTEILGFVDWQLLVLFISLFIINKAFYETGLPGFLVTEADRVGINFKNPDILFFMVVSLSNIVSNVPAVMLLLPWAADPQVGSMLALASTFAGNLFIGGSIANIIVVEQAAREGIFISWRDHARIGIPVSIITLAVADVCLKMGRFLGP